MQSYSLILGTANFSRGYGVLGQSPKKTEVDIEGVLNFAAERNFLGFDTAPRYGEAETRIGMLASGLKAHTKLSSATAPMASIRASLRALRRDFLDVVYLHETLTLEPPQRARIAELSDLVGHTVGEVGASVYTTREFDLALHEPLITVIQLPLNFFDRRFDPELIRLAVSEGKKVFFRSIFLQGLLVSVGQKLPRSVNHLAPFLEGFRTLADDFGVTPLELAVGYVTHFFEPDGLVFGLSSTEEGGAIMKALSFDVSQPLSEAMLAFNIPNSEAVDPRNWG